ncbi:YfcL family protein [Vibrio ostreicida]|uniref:YfcL family protein n=1 Tax=Vibrio ostreicida TaxID=526588 RepID=A0ABT8BU30_9VIBR|nr:YfcL family protein [Vibrio ostreicida]MDN3610650.1 YfcL family protein [Vibrio ostreicida]NPD07352.1 YfcL family protein [Vibrio ostreicida]
MIIEYEEQLFELIDARISSASDDELFAGGYLRGHIALSAAACEEDGTNDVKILKARVKASLDDARSELTPADRIIVNDLWQELVNNI